MPPSSSDYDQRTALHLACSEGHLEAVQLLIEEGADPNLKDRFGSTCLDDATRAGHRDLVAYLLLHKATHGGLDKLQAKLLDMCAKGDVVQAQSLLANDANGEPVLGSAGISANCCDYDKRTPLHLAVAEGHMELVALLLANGADVHAQDRWGLTPLAECDRKAARVGLDPIKELFRAGGFLPQEHASLWSFFTVLFGFWEVAMMILFGLFCTYGESVDGGRNLDAAVESDNVVRALAGLPALPYQTVDEFRSLSGSDSLGIARVYPMYQDVHVMIFAGFGFLMVFLRKHGYTSVGLTFLLAAFVIQWSETHTRAATAPAPAALLQPSSPHTAALVVFVFGVTVRDRCGCG